VNEGGEIPKTVEVSTPTVLYRGAREKLGTLVTQPILTTEKNRFPTGTESVVFASQYKEEALAYAIASRYGVGGFMLAPFWKDEQNKIIGWKLSLNCKSSDLPREDKTYLYEFNPTSFSLNSVGEWYSPTNVIPNQRQELTIENALKYFDEVKFANE